MRGSTFYGVDISHRVHGSYVEAVTYFTYSMIDQLWTGSCHYMDKKETGERPAEDFTRESLIAISYRLPDKDPAPGLLPKKLDNVIEGTNGDRDENYRSKLISISYTESADTKSLPVSPGEAEFNLMGLKKHQGSLQCIKAIWQTYVQHLYQQYEEGGCGCGCVAIEGLDGKGGGSGLERASPRMGQWWVVISG
ncbi:hypothetical protein RJ639_009541 [Escallonia herrerae]|uniref:Uncharacterized protein n=1 Tax=Escallonia herrerae TaxID=1293975 RepID=A0AA88VQC9_9ASTE|nr:hypothetical protein RJ639_009541 [Escallonia herrerae]